MTLVEVFDRLCGKRITRIDFKDGSHVQCLEPMLVDLPDSDTPAEAWIEASADGLVLHFNAKLVSHDGGMEMRAETEPLGNIAAVA